MSAWQIIAGMLFFALMGAILYVWGLKKSIDQQQDLSHNLLNACGSKVVRYLKKHDTITLKEMADVIADTTAGQFWSRKKLKVQDPRKFAKTVAEYLEDQQYIEPVSKDTYRLKEIKK